MRKIRKTIKKGLTFIEAMTVLGIMLILSGAAYFGYIYHYDVTGKLATLNHLGINALQKMQNCLEMSVVQTGTESFDPIPPNTGTTWPGCDSKLKLGLQDCEDCSEPLITSNQIICLEITNGKFKQCVAYRHPSAAWNTDKPFKVTVNYKVCVKRYASGASAVSAVWPYKPCTANSDCETGQECPAKRLGVCVSTNINQGGCT